MGKTTEKSDQFARNGPSGEMRESTIPKMESPPSQQTGAYYL